MSWINTLRTSAQDFGTLAENNSSTSSQTLHRKYKQLFFFIQERRLIFLCSYSFWRWSNYFFKAVEGLQFLTRAESIFFYLCSFSRRAVCHVCTCIQNGTFNHCGRSKAWNSTHYGRYVFFVRFIHTYIYTYIYTYTYTYISPKKKTCTKTCACARLGGWLCGRVVWCGVVWCGVLMCWCPSPWYSQT